MADVEQFTEEQAQALLEETMFGSASTAAPAEEKKEEVVEQAPPVEDEVEKKEEEQKEEGAPAEKEKEPEKTEPSDPYAWVNDIPEAIRDKVVAEINEKFQFKHQADSNKGRLKSFQQKLLEAQQQLAVQGRPATPAKGQPAPAEAKPPTTPEGWNELIKSDPELAKAIEARVTSGIESAVQTVRSEFQELKKTAIAPLYENQTAQYVEQQRQELERQVPNVHQVLASKEYNYWINNVAPEGIKNTALRSTDAETAVSVLRTYANDMVRLGYFEEPKPGAAPVQSDTSKADKVAADREAKLKAQTVVRDAPLAPIPGRSNGPVTQDEAERIFNEEYKKLMSKKT